jgi:hypothetical protein
MPRVLPKKPKFKTDEIVVAWTGFATGHTAVQRGTRLRGDSPLVKGHPQYFVKDGTPANEMPGELDGLVPSPSEPPEFHRPAPPIPDEEACEVAMDVMIAGRPFRRGQRVRRDDPAVRGNEQFFRTVGQPLDAA